MKRRARHEQTISAHCLSQRQLWRQRSASELQHLVRNTFASGNAQRLAPRWLGARLQLGRIRCVRNDSCVLPQGGVANRNVTGFEASSDRNHLNAVHLGFIDVQSAQCGCRLSDMVMTANILPDLNPDPCTTLRRPVLSSNLCPCGTHLEEILAAARRAARLYRESLCNE
jgi:xanthine dehydrogenase iron-sulfur cluster and FAD-binding subunit A